MSQITSDTTNAPLHVIPELVNFYLDEKDHRQFACTDRYHNERKKNLPAKERFCVKEFNELCNNERDISFINSIDKKICDTLGIDSSFSEPIQAQRYTVTQQFKPHTDFFSEDEYDEHCVYQGNRTWTFMIYLNTVQEGGETYMCKINKKFIPQSGTALIWNNLNQNGRGNENTLHSGEPVLKGSKYIITKWFRQKSASAAVEPVG